MRRCALRFLRQLYTEQGLRFFASTLGNGVNPFPAFFPPVCAGPISTASGQPLIASRNSRDWPR